MNAVVDSSICESESESSLWWSYECHMGYHPFSVTLQGLPKTDFNRLDNCWYLQYLHCDFARRVPFGISHVSLLMKLVMASNMSRAGGQYHWVAAS